jgi:hypothetical protein
VLLLDGSRGTAVLRLDFSRAEERARLRAKARLMATALAAEAYACLFETCLHLRGRPPVPVVVTVAEARAGGSVRLFAREGAALRQLDGGLTGPRIAGTLADFLDDLIPASPSDRASARAWRELEAMGVNIGGARLLH